MSTVNTATLQADTIVAKNGDATKEVSIPGLDKRFVNSSLNIDSSSGNVVIRNTRNISSIVRVGAGHFTATFISPQPNDGYMFSGSSTAKYTVSGSGARDTQSFDFYVTNTTNGQYVDSEYVIVVLFEPS